MKRRARRRGEKERRREKESRGCMHRRFIIKKTWLFAFSYAQPRISLVICHSLGFLVPWFSSLIDKTDLADFVCYLWRKKVGGGGGALSVCLQKLYLTVTDMFKISFLLCTYKFKKI
jgi:hypothetical protein